MKISTILDILKILKILNSFVVAGYSNMLIQNTQTQKFESLSMEDLKN